MTDKELIALFDDLRAMPRKIHLIKPKQKSKIELPEGVTNTDLLLKHGGLVAAVGTEVEGPSVGDRAWPGVYAQPEMAFERKGEILQVFDIGTISAWQVAGTAPVDEDEVDGFIAEAMSVPKKHVDNPGQAPIKGEA